MLQICKMIYSQCLSLVNRTILDTSNMSKNCLVVIKHRKKLDGFTALQRVGKGAGRSIC